MANSERFETELPPDLAQFVHSQVGHGALASDSDVLREAVRVFHREHKLQGLREMISTSIERGGENTDQDLERALDTTAEELREEGY